MTRTHDTRAIALARGARAPVDHHRQEVFLFNYFYADRTHLNLAAWQYTAGWFADQTGLDDSTVLPPDPTSPASRASGWSTTPAGIGSATSCPPYWSSTASAPCP
jgi:hypothetical protein